MRGVEPRAEARLNYVERSFDADGWPKLSLGEPGRPWLQRAFLVQPGRVARPAPPAPAEILRAARSHRRMRRRLAREEEALIGDEGVPGVEDDDVRAGGVSFVEERPQAMWLVAYAYVPQGEEDRRWYITDPFGLGPSERLRGWVERERTRSKPLGAELLRFLHGRGEEAAGDASEVAKLTLDQRHGIAVRSHPAFEALVEVETVLGSGTLSAWMARAAYAALRRALEVLFGPLARRAPWRDLSGQDAVFNRQHLDACAVQVGLAPLPNAVLKVRQGQVRSAAEFNGGSLRARVAAAVLAAARSSDHRLRSAAGRDPRVLERVEALAVAAGDAVHASGFRLDRDRLKADVEELHALVGALGLGDNGRQEGW